MLSSSRLRSSLVMVPLLVASMGEPSALAEELPQKELQSAPPAVRRFAFTLSGLFAPSYANPTLSDGHSLPRGDGPSLGLRADARFKPLPWLGLGLGGDYLSNSTVEGPGGHLAIPVIVAFTPLRIPRFELGAALGVGPSWGWYESWYHAAGDDTTLRGSGFLVELRVEGGFPVSPMFSIQTSVGSRLQVETSYSNPGPYATGGTATALDLGLGARLNL